MNISNHHTYIVYHWVQVYHKPYKTNFLDSFRMLLSSYLKTFSHENPYQDYMVDLQYNSSLKFEIKAKQFYAASQRVL